jgi:hypothetical protein
VLIVLYEGEEVTRSQLCFPFGFLLHHILVILVVDRAPATPLTLSTTMCVTTTKTHQPQPRLRNSPTSEYSLLKYLIQRTCHDRGGGAGVETFPSCGLDPQCSPSSHPSHKANQHLKTSGIQLCTDVASPRPKPAPP